VTRSSGARGGPDDRDEPRALRDALAEVTSDLGLPDPDAFGSLVAHWHDLVGGEMASHCRLESLRGGVLRVTADTAPRATQLRYRESELLRQASVLVGRDVVRAVHVRIAS
jgi:predicted nucleic acid-binding Zn ribbon protein